MDLTIPYTFYPIALPHRIAWMLFLVAVAGSAATGWVTWQRRGWRAGLGSALAVLAVLLAGTMLASMVIAFFLHDV